MIDESFDSLEVIWDALLSREDKRICEVYRALDEKSRAVAYEHLGKMATEEGWHPEQRKSAEVALKVLKDIQC